MKKISKEDIKNFWETNKKKIIIGGGAIAGMTMTVIGYVMFKKHCNASSDVIEGFEEGLAFWRSEPSRPVPETDGFKILDIADDINDDCVVWLDGCKLADCGKLGEGLIKIEGVNPDVMTTMVILGKDKVDSI